MHLAGEADTSNVLGTQPRFLNGPRHGNAAGTPPIFGMLLGPSDFRRRKWHMFFRGRSDNAPLFVDDQRPRPARSYVNAKCVDIRLPREMLPKGAVALGSFLS
jgi:hypothetical protein